MKKSLLLVFAAFLSYTTSAQSYTFTHSTASYANLVGSTSLNQGQIWDDPDFTVPIGFTFELFGSPLTQIKISSDGLGGWLTDQDCSAGVVQKVVIPFGADIIDRGYNNGVSVSPISYRVEGVPGNRICKIEWKNVGFYDGLIGTNGQGIDYVNFQLWLYEMNDIIEMRYGPSSVLSPQNDYDGENGTYVGLLQMNCDTYDIEGTNILLDGNPNSPVAQYLFTSDTAYILNNTIPNGKVYRFTPAAGSLDELVDNAHELSVFPNPAISEITISLENSDIQDIYIVDLSGKIIWKGQFVDKLDVSGLQAGQYVLSVIDVDGEHYRKLITKQ